MSNLKQEEKCPFPPTKKSTCVQQHAESYTYQTKALISKEIIYLFKNKYSEFLERYKGEGEGRRKKKQRIGWL